MLTETQIRTYRRDGFVRLPGLIAGRELEAVQAAAERVVAAGIEFGEDLDRRAPVPVGVTDPGDDLDVFFERKLLYAADGQGRRVFRRAEEPWERDPAFRAVTAHPAILNAVWQVLGSPFIPSNESLVVKMPGAGAVVPWHRDVPIAALRAVGGDVTHDFTVDIYLDRSTPENGCLRAIPRSHRGTPAEVAPDDFSRDDAVLVPAEPGDVLLHATGLLHGSPPNHSAELRRTFYLHYRGPHALAAETTRSYIRRIRRAEPEEWIAGQAEFLRTVIAERAALSYDDTETYVGPLAVPAA